MAERGGTECDDLTPRSGECHVEDTLRRGAALGGVERDERRATFPLRSRLNDEIKAEAVPRAVPQSLLQGERNDPVARCSDSTPSACGHHDVLLPVEYVGHR